MKAFYSYSLSHGLLEDLRNDEFPTLLSCWNNDDLIFFSKCTSFGYVWQGQAVLHCNDSGALFVLNPGMLFSLPGKGSLLARGNNSKGIVITRMGYEGTFNIGGPIEKSGRLKYINGATDNVLIHPPICGDPVLNALYFKPVITQTEHYHPSMRIGIIASGYGKCVTPDEEIELIPGQAFIIPANAKHSFHTSDSPMVVVAFHPDSQTGPTDGLHPMIQMTLVNGVSASELEGIKTRVFN